MSTNTDITTGGNPGVTSFIRARPATRSSRGGIDDVNPDDIIYGEYANGYEDKGNWIDLIYLDDDILRTFSGSIESNHPVLDELKLLLKGEDVYYVIPIKELPYGFAFKRMDVGDIKVSSLIKGNANHVPSCVWTLYFQKGTTRTLETDYQSYFAYGTTTRPASMTNASILDSVFTNREMR